MEDISFFAKTVTRPSWTLSNQPHKFINHTFNYPGRVEWNAIDMTFVDVVDPDISAGFLKVLRLSGYNWPTGPSEGSQTVTKKSATEAIGSIYIRQIGEDQSDILDEWRLENAWVSEVAVGDLSYEDDGMVEVTTKIIYDWAYMSTSGRGQPGFQGARVGGQPANKGSKDNG
tara:strand:- start:819 stop:1334 length:516 start_codon:yes stop_codon:yes gene_type:complete